MAVDGFQGGIQTIGLGSTPVTLTAPVGFTATPSPGPTQSQNAVLRLTGALTGNVQITLPLPGYYIVENLTTGNFVVTLQGLTATQVVSIDQGMCQHIYNDGANVRFVNLGKVGEMEFWCGLSAIPAWVSACTIPPYLLCDGTATYLFSTYPYLGKRNQANFGGNGASTFGVPDMRGRVPLAYDGTGTRITSAISGINGQTLGAAGGDQSLQSHVHINTLNDPGHTHNLPPGLNTTSGGGGQSGTEPGANYTSSGQTVSSSTTGVSIRNASVGNGNSQNVQPSQVVGIWVIRAA